jgi:predicted TPR repeat methyltransferase
MYFKKLKVMSTKGTKRTRKKEYDNLVSVQIALWCSSTGEKIELATASDVFPTP